jgi:23S rRNA (uridine2552-2'-O)-methyltransferase
VDLMMGKNNRKRPDSWSRKAKEQGFSARSVYKLEEINRRFRVCKGVRRVIDLGCAPGSWSEFVRKTRPNVTLVGIDIQQIDVYPGKFICASILDTSSDVFFEHLNGTADLVLSDMAPNTTGDRFSDHIRQIELAKCALETAMRTLRQGGTFIVKVFDGEEAPSFVLDVKKQFQQVKRVKPEAVRNESVEFFLVARNKRSAIHWKNN